MCGIGGAFGYSGRDNSSGTAIDSMIATIVHRGPDDRGVHIDGDLALGVRRLSIIDVDGGRQPVTSEDGSVVAVVNGEIYNHQELREKLQGRGHRFVSRSDSEVIPHLYEEVGPRLVHQLRGMFGLAVWDARQRRLLLARDRLGIKPLYAADDGTRLVFGSEIKSVLAHPAVPAHLDPAALSQYLSLKYVPSPATLFAGITSLPPGCLLTCDASGARVERYWDLRMDPAAAGGDEATQAASLAALLRESVALHMQSDVPFGAFLSGGIDSSLIVALMSETATEPVRTFSVGFTAGGASVGELPYAAMVAARFATKHAPLVMTGRDFADAVERVVWHLDQPVGDVAAVPMLFLSDLAARDVKMVLSGEGGDELFAGYARYVGEQIAPLLRCLPPALRLRALRALASVVRQPRPRLALRALAESNDLDRLVNWFPLFDNSAKRSLLSSEFAAALDRSAASARPVEADQAVRTAEAVVRAPFAELLSRTTTPDRLSQMLYCDTKLWLPDDLLARGDKMSMAASIELRVPLLDHRVVEFAAGLPSSLKLRRLHRKLLLRTVARDLLPPEVLARRKEGFPMPVATWWRQEARELLTDTLSDATVRRRGLLDPAFVRTLVADHLTCRADHGSALWGLVALEIWFRRFLDP